jgi:hypothetical protein
MRVYYIVQHDNRGDHTMFHWGLFTWRQSALDVVALKEYSGINATWTVEETFIVD